MARRKKKKKNKLLAMLIIVVLALIEYYVNDVYDESYAIPVSKTLEEVPDYSGNSYIIINDNIPSFNDSEYTTKSFETYSSLDIYSRCGVAYANIGKDLMPTTKRESIGQIKPSGWHTTKYETIIDGKYLYNRCHLIGYQLTGENANPRNLITCTRQMNTVGMLEFENKVTEYIKKTNNHVLYRVTPIFEGNNLVAKGVQIEASSVEDHCGEICFNIFVYNVQDGIEIDYATGKSHLTNDISK